MLPTTKTFVSLISALSKGADDAMDVVVEVCQCRSQHLYQSSNVSMQQTAQTCEYRAQAIKHEVDNGTTEGKRSATYSAAMAACEKAGQWELAVKLFDKVTTISEGFNPALV